MRLVIYLEGYADLVSDDTALEVAKANDPKKNPKLRLLETTDKHGRNVRRWQHPQEAEPIAVHTIERGRELQLEASDELFAWLGVPPGKIFADLPALQAKHPEYFSSPEAVKRALVFAFAHPEYVLAATKPSYTLLVSKRAAKATPVKSRVAVVVELELRGGKYRVRSVYWMSEAQAQTKVRAAAGVRKDRKGKEK